MPDLIGLNAGRTYNKMRQDAQIASLLLAFTLPIRRYRWVIEPNGASDAVVEWVANNMSLPIAGQEDAPLAVVATASAMTAMCFMPAEPVVRAHVIRAGVRLRRQGAPSVAGTDDNSLDRLVAAVYRILADARVTLTRMRGDRRTK